MANDLTINNAATGATSGEASPPVVNNAPVANKAAATPSPKTKELTAEEKEQKAKGEAKWNDLLQSNSVIKAIVGLLEKLFPGFAKDASNPTVAKNPAHMRIMEELQDAAYSKGSVVSEARVENQYIAAIDNLIKSGDIKLDKDPAKATEEYGQLVACIKESISGPGGAVKIDQNEIAKKMRDFGAEFKDPAKPVPKETGDNISYGAKVEIKPDYLKSIFNEGSSLHAMHSDGKGGIKMEVIDNYGSKRDLDMLGGKGLPIFGGGADTLSMERVFLNKKDPVSGKMSQENQGLFISDGKSGFYVGTDAIRDEARVSLLEKLKPNAPQDPSVPNPALNVTNKPAAPGMVAGP